jgi:uncharacterized protein (TIGR02145 family)
MKKLLFLSAIICALNVNAQNYLITFAGSGASTTVSTVKVENLTKGTSLTLNGDDILRLTGTVGISQVDYKKLSGMKLYPNPMTGNSILQISPPVEGNAIITVFDMTGRLVAQIQSFLEKYQQEFRLSGISSGLYLISVKGNTYQYSEKLLCNGSSEGTISIEKISNNQAVIEKTSKMDHKGDQATVDMLFTYGDRLKFTATSGNYSTVLTDIPTDNKTVTFKLLACTDSDNSNYPVVQIGTQVWMAENLRATKYRNGTAIPLVPGTNEGWLNLNTPAYCWYNNDESANKASYGALYNWYTVNTGNLCPTGWHVPNDEEWRTLTTYLGGLNAAGGKLKETGTTHWASPNTSATNETGFTALPGGTLCHSFIYIGNFGLWWSVTEILTISAWNRYLSYNSGTVVFDYPYKVCGLSVRCLKD